MTIFERTASSRPALEARHTAIQGNRQESRAKKITELRFETGPSRKDILNFTNQLAVMIKAGISLQDSLESIGTQVKKEKFRAIIIDLKNRIEGGQSFSQALGEHTDIFSNL